MYGKCKVEGLGGAEGGRGQVDGSDSPAQQSKSLKATTEVAKHKYRLWNMGRQQQSPPPCPNTSSDQQIIFFSKAIWEMEGLRETPNLTYVFIYIYINQYPMFWTKIYKGLELTQMYESK